MKQLICEMCTSNDLVKQDGFFVCQNCGTKYSVEEAKKMMVEGTVDVTGTVRIDTSDELQNLYQLARRAKEDENAENACKYYDMIAVKDPTSWEAAFYNVYFQARQTNIMNIQPAAVKVDNCLKGVFELIKNHVTDIEEREKAISGIIVDVGIIANMMASAASNHYYDTDARIRDRYEGEFTGRSVACTNLMYHCGDYIEAVFEELELQKWAGKAWILGIGMQTRGNFREPYLSKLTDCIVRYADFYSKEELETVKKYAVGVLNTSKYNKKKKENPVPSILGAILVSGIIVALIVFFVSTLLTKQMVWGAQQWFWTIVISVVIGLGFWGSSIPKESQEELTAKVEKNEKVLATIEQAISKK